MLRSKVETQKVNKEKILKLSESIKLLKHSNVTLKTNMKVEMDKFGRDFWQISKCVASFKPRVMSSEIEKMKELLLLQEQSVMSKKWAVEDRLRQRMVPKRNRY